MPFIIARRSAYDWSGRRDLTRSGRFLRPNEMAARGEEHQTYTRRDNAQRSANRLNQKARAEAAIIGQKYNVIARPANCFSVVEV